GGFELLDRCLQALDDGLALAGDAIALQGLRFGFGFGLLHLENLVGFAAGLRRNLLALRGIDVVHGGFDLGVGHDVRDESAENVVAEGVHHDVEVFFDGGGNLLHLLEGLVEGERGHVAEDGVEDVALNLGLRIAELVIGVKDLLFDDLELHGDRNGDEDVVFAFGFNVDHSLADLEIDEAHIFAPGQQNLQAGTRDAVEFAEALDDAGGVGAHGVHGFEERNEDEDADDGGD